MGREVVLSDVECRLSFFVSDAAGEDVSLGLYSYELKRDFPRTIEQEKHALLIFFELVLLLCIGGDIFEKHSF